MPTASAEADPMFQLLTDALRAGPGSPEWHEAVAQLRAGGEARDDEYQMLISARQHLESGKEYRSVRAGAGFTRKLMQGIAEEEATGGRPRLPTANLIALISALAILAVLALVAFQLFPRGNVEPQRATVEDLYLTTFGSEVIAANFDGAIPAGWRTIGALPLDTAGGLHPASAASTTLPSDGAPLGGGVVTQQPLNAGETFVAEATLRLQKPAPDLLVELFVSSDADFSPDRGTSSNEFTWLVQGDREKVVSGDGRVLADVKRPAGRGAGESMALRILVNKEMAVVEAGGQRVWAGPHGLAARPRYVGARFLRLDSKAVDGAAVASLRIMKK